MTLEIRHLDGHVLFRTSRTQDAARLSAANLEQADLRGADLTNADLRGSTLESCKFEDARLDGARLDTNAPGAPSSSRRKTPPSGPYR